MRTAPYLAIAATLILWASSFPAIKAGLDGYSPLSLAALRFAAASLVLGCAAPFLGIRLPQRRHGALVLALGLIGVAGYHILLNYGEALATASAAAFIANAAPLFTTIMAKAMGERVGRRAWLGLLAGLAGVWLIGGSFSARGFFDPGAALLLGAALCWSLFFVLQKPLLTQHSPLEVTCYAVWIGTIALALFLPDAIVELRSASLSATLSALYLGVLPTRRLSLLGVCACDCSRVAGGALHISGPGSFGGDRLCVARRATKPRLFSWRILRAAGCGDRASKPLMTRAVAVSFQSRHGRDLLAADRGD